MNKISIIIVNYKSGDFLYNCLDSIQKNVRDIEYEVIVVDNASPDDSYTRCLGSFDNERMKFIQSGANLGFAKANNLGVQHATGNIYHFLNPDTIVYESINSSYQIVMKDPSKVYVNNLENPDGSIINIGHILPVLQVYFKRLFTKRVPKWYLGASVIISSANFELIGRWNERFFMYAEDVNLFYQLYKHNIKIEVLPSIIFHAGGGSSKNTWTSKERLKIVKKSTKQFYKENQISWQYPFLRLFQMIYSLKSIHKRRK